MSRIRELLKAYNDPKKDENLDVSGEALREYLWINAEALADLIEATEIFLADMQEISPSPNEGADIWFTVPPEHRAALQAAVQRLRE